MKAIKLLWICIFILFVSVQVQSQEKDNNQKLINSISDKDYHSNIVILYDSTDVDVKESGLSYVTNHRLIKIINESGAKSYRQINLNYDPLSADIQFKFAKIYHKDGTVETIGKSKFYDNPAPAHMIYWGSRNKSVEFGRLEPGDAIEWTTLRKGFTYALLFNNDEDKFIPPMKGNFYDIVRFWSGVTILEKVYRIAMPKDKPLQYEVYNGEVSSYVHFPKIRDKKITVEVNPQENQSGIRADTKNFYQKKDKIVYCWYKKNIKPFKGEPNMVSASDVATKLLLSSAKDWYAKGIWFNKVNEDYHSFDVTKPIKAKVDKIISGAKNEMAIISRLTHWVADEIRYSGISMGKGEGYTLHKGQTTFKDRCGVCKDKAGMLITMLRAAGIEAYPAMTMAGSRIDKIPADQFNHSVSLAKLKNGNWILLDPTWVPGVRELWSSAEQQQQFLMGIPGGADLKTTPISPAENHFLKLTGNSTLRKDGTLAGTFVLTGEGQADASLRRMFVRSYRSSWKNVIPEYLSRISPNVKIIKQSYSNPYNISKPLRIEVKYEISDYALITEDEILFTPLLAANPINNYSTSSELYTRSYLKKRKYGFRERCSKLVEVEETINLPKYKKAIEIPKFQKVTGDASDFNAQYVLKKNKLKFTMTHKMKKRIYEASDWANFRETLLERKKLMKSKIILEK